MNELMTGLQCQCGHDYACHAPAPYTGCGECDCTISRADIAERGGRLLATAIAERDALRGACEAFFAAVDAKDKAYESLRENDTKERKQKYVRGIAQVIVAQAALHATLRGGDTL